MASYYFSRISYVKYKPGNGCWEEVGGKNDPSRSSWEKVKKEGCLGGDTPLYKALFCSFTDIYLSIVFVILFFGFGTAQL